ncbi:MAG: NUDIX hydrolase, partial [Betaproteobacteria bacterium]|nr:NUDIX hydrolase [Betaproteobacteria bacterium]
MSQIKRPYDMPFTRVELILMALKDAQLQVLIAKRAEEPHKGKWAIP